jgi:hypothetical protein
MQATRRFFAALSATLPLVFGLAHAAHAEVKSLTLGISTNCPYGLAG